MKGVGAPGGIYLALDIRPHSHVFAYDSIPVLGSNMRNRRFYYTALLLLCVSCLRDFFSGNYSPLSTISSWQTKDLSCFFSAQLCVSAVITIWFIFSSCTIRILKYYSCKCHHLCMRHSMNSQHQRGFPVRNCANDLRHVRCIFIKGSLYLANFRGTDSWSWWVDLHTIMSVTSSCQPHFQLIVWSVRVVSSQVKPKCTNPCVSMVAPGIPIG